MTARHTLSSKFKPTAGAAIVAFSILAQFAIQETAALPPSNCPIVTSSASAFNLLSTIALTALLRTLQVYVLDYQQLLQGLCQMWLSCWSLLVVIGAATLLRAAFTRKVEA